MYFIRKLKKKCDFYKRKSYAVYADLMSLIISTFLRILNQKCQLNTQSGVQQ